MKVYCVAINPDTGAVECMTWEHEGRELAATTGKLFGHVLGYSTVSHADAEQNARSALSKSAQQHH